MPALQSDSSQNGVLSSGLHNPFVAIDSKTVRKETRGKKTEVLNEVLFLFLCMCVVSLGIDDGCVCIGRVLGSLRLIG